MPCGVDRVADLPGAAEVQVFQGAAELTDGGSFSFGSTVPGVPVDKTFRVRNTGTANLTLQPVSVPAGFTVVSNIPANTVLASGAETTFTVRMTAAATGTFSGELSFANDDANENPFNFTISGTAATTRIIDNGDEGFTTVGNWQPFTGQGLNNDVQYASGGGGSQTASWTFAVTPGQYQVAITWSTDPNRATDAPFSVIQGSHTLVSEDINQEQAPNDFTDAGVGWRNLGGTLNVAGGTLVVRLSDDANQYVIADGVRLQRIGDLPAVQIVDNGDAPRRHRRHVVVVHGPGFSRRCPGQRCRRGADTTSWTFPVTPGQYRVSATWTTHVNRATDAPFTVLDGTTPLYTVLIDQEQAPNDLSDAGVQWEHPRRDHQRHRRHTDRAAIGCGQSVGDRRRRAVAAVGRPAGDDGAGRAPRCDEVADGGSFSFGSTFPGARSIRRSAFATQARPA